MKIASCPGCGADLEIPGGESRVVCPYCETEFAPTGLRAPVSGGAGPRRGGGAPRRGAGRSRGGRGGDYDEYEEEYDRGFRRKKMDPTPIIIAVIAVVVLGGGLAFFLMKASERVAKQEQRRIAELGLKQRAYFPPPKALTPSGDSFEFFCDYQADEKITFQRLDYNTYVHYSDSTGVKDKPIYSETYSVSNNKELTNERILAREGDIATHRGRYQLRSYQVGKTNHVPSPVWFEAEFQTNRLGNAVPGSLKQVEGTTLSMIPAMLAERGFGIIDGKMHRQGERWGTANLPDKVLTQLDCGFDPRSIPLSDGGRIGGWFISGGRPIKTSRGNWEKRQAHLELTLKAVENRFTKTGRYRGMKAEISVAVEWRGRGMYELGKRMISNVRALSVNCEVIVKTRDSWHHWISGENLDAEIFKDS